MTLSGYTITGAVLADGETVLERGRRTADGAPVLIRRPQGEYPGLREIERLRLEHAITRELDLPGVVRARALERDGGGVALVLDDPGGRPLADALREGRLGLEPALRIAAGLAATLAAVHRRGIVHRDVSPRNVLVDLEAGAVWLTGFGIAARTPERTQAPEATLGALEYMAPEQTGRMGRAPDHRADLYSLGVMLHEALTGALPFPSADPAELVYAHLARVPAPPREVAPEIPEVVSAIVGKLLEKAAEDRYQSAAGLEADLVECLVQLHGGGASASERGTAFAGLSIAPFPLGRHDVPCELQIPPRRYGGEAESAALLSAWARACGGAIELALIEGPAGIGKSTLIEELRGAVEREGGCFAAGAFEDPGRSTPHAALWEALRELCRQLLTESAASLARWRAELLAALGQTGRVLVHDLPELGLILGPQPALQDLTPTAAQNRFDLVFQALIGVFAAGPRPVAICLDDLHRADPASLRLLPLLVAGARGGRLLVVGALEGAVAEAGEPLARAIDAIRAAGKVSNASTIAPAPLARPAVVRLLADTLACDEERAGPLADLCLARTGGNPLALRHLLETLYDEQLIAFDAPAGGFAWDLARVEASVFDGDAGAFTTARLERLPPPARRALGLAACIGRRFDLEVVALLDGRPAAEVAADLNGAIRERLVVPIDPAPPLQGDGDAEPGASEGARVSYEIPYDRALQAASALLGERERQAAHLALARLLFARGLGSGDEVLFEAVQHANLGAALIEDPEERLETARRNLAAGQRARTHGAHRAAAGYSEAGTALLGEDGWTAHYELAFALHLQLAECEHLEGQVDRAEALFDALLERARSDVDRARVENARVVLYAKAGRAADAIRVGHRALLLLGIDLGDTEEARQRAMKDELAELEMNLEGRPIESLIEAPTMTDPVQRVALELLVNLHFPALHLNTALLSSIVYAQVNCSLRHGHSELSSYGYMAYGRILARTSRRYPEAYAFGKLALDLDARCGTADLRCRLSYFFGSFLHLMEPLRTVLPYFTRAIDAGVESGDLHYASFACCDALAIQLALGEDLRELEEQATRFIAITTRARQAICSAFLVAGRQAIRNLTGATRDRGTLSDDGFDERSFAAALNAPDLVVTSCFYHTLKLELLFLHGDVEGALREATLAEEQVEKDVKILGMHFATELSFYSALAAGAQEAPRVPSSRPRRAATPGEHARRIEGWTDNCPANFRHKHVLLAAERARLDGDEVEAMARYDEAIEAARDNEFPRDEALANEISARFHLQRNRPKVARTYMTDAYYGYLRWGAIAKAADIARAHPDLLIRTGAISDASGASSSRGTERTDLLDVAIFVRAARALAEEIVLDRVLAQLMRIVLESAGAQRGVLLLDRDGRLTVEASIEAATGAVELGRPIPAEQSTEIPLSIVQYVARTQAPVVLGDATRGGRFSTDPYIAGSEPRSLLCIPLPHQGGVSGILYLENNAARDAFSPARIELLRVISSQAAIAIRNAMLYARVQAVSDEILQSNERLEAEVARRTEQLSDANRQLAGELTRRADAERERATLQEKIIGVQRERLQELSTPLMPITDRVTVMPLMGAMDTERAQQVLEMALGGARESRTLVMILDVTGVKGVDSGVAGMLVRTAEALRILGTEAVITGIRPEVARTIVGLGLDLGSVATLSTLQRGIAYALERTERDPRSFRAGWGMIKGGKTA